MQRLTTYRDSEGMHTLWRFSNGIYELENHTTGRTCEIDRDIALGILHYHGHNSRRVYVPTLSERYDRPPQMHQFGYNVFAWE